MKSKQIVQKFNENFDLRLVKGSPCLIVGDFLVISDIHLGFEENLSKKGIFVPDRTNDLIKKLSQMRVKTKRKNLLVLGDLKDSYNRINKNEWRNVPIFLRYCSNNFEKVIITKGNHDSMLERLNVFKNVVIVKELVFEFKDKKIGFIHGHSWPSKKLIKECEIIVIGHSHPSYVFKNHLGQINTMSAWFIGGVNKSFLTKAMKLNEFKLNKLIVLPCFNDFFSGSDEKLGPLMKAMKDVKKVLLDFEIID